MKNLATTYEKSGKKEQAAAMEDYATKAMKNALDMESRNNLRSMLGGGDVIRPKMTGSFSMEESRRDKILGGSRSHGAQGGSRASGSQEGSKRDGSLGAGSVGGSKLSGLY